METFIEHLAGAINVNGSTVSAHDRLADFPNWDSLAMLTTLSMLDMEYGVTVSGSELQSCSKVEDLYALVLKKRDLSK